MRRPLLVAIALVLSIAAPALAHRVDEYLQATTISVERERIRAELRMVPGIELFPRVLALVDADGDGVLSASEQRAYAERVRGDLSLVVDGVPLPLRVDAVRFASLEELREGRGAIRIALDATVPRRGSTRRLVFENHHERATAEYLVNALVPRDPGVRLGTQHRDYEQTRFELEYVQDPLASPGALRDDEPEARSGWFLLLALLPLASVPLIRRRGMRAPIAAPK